MKLVIVEFPPISRHIIPLWSKHSPQHPVLKRLQMNVTQRRQYSLFNHNKFILFKGKVKVKGKVVPVLN
jgi:hypothetical protein